MLMVGFLYAGGVGIIAAGAFLAAAAFTAASDVEQLYAVDLLTDVAFLTAIGTIIGGVAVMAVGRILETVLRISRENRDMRNAIEELRAREEGHETFAPIAME